MKKTFWIINLILLAVMAVGTYCYQVISGLKITCCSVFVVLGLVNLIFTLCYNRKAWKFSLGIAVGLIMAISGDYYLGVDFVLGASLFALAHVCYFSAQSILISFKLRDLIPSLILFASIGSFLMFCPLLDFGGMVNQIVCLVYALIISMMTGKAISNFIREKNAVTTVLVIGCSLFLFSDLMLCASWFMDTGRITSILCMVAYYPAEILLAHAVYHHAVQK